MGILETLGACDEFVLSRVERGVLFDVLGVQSGAMLHGATLTLDAAEHELAFVQDPCSLLTTEEVALAVGSAVQSAGLVPPFGMKLPGSGPVCSYDAPTTPYSSVNVGIETSTLQRFDSEAAADEANFMDITGVGERAYIAGMGSIAVFDDGRDIRIGLQHGAGDPAIPLLEALGRAAIDDVDAAEEGPDTLAESLAGTSWELAYVDGRSWPVGDESAVILTFGPADVSGSDGCNEYAASWEVNGEELSIGDFGGTHLACAGDAAWVADRTRSILAASPRVGFSGEELRLVAEEGVLNFNRVDAGAPMATYVDPLGWSIDVPEVWHTITRGQLRTRLEMELLHG